MIDQPSIDASSYTFAAKALDSTVAYVGLPIPPNDALSKVL
jgi:hypothetical protein